MDLERLTKHQTVLLCLLVSLFTAIFTAIVVVTLMEQAPQTVVRTINKVVENTVEKVVPVEREVTTIETVVVDTEEQVASLTEALEKALIRIYDEDNSYVGMAVAIDENGLLFAPTARSEGEYIGVFASGDEYTLTYKEDAFFLDIGTDDLDYTLELGTPTLGDTVIALGGEQQFVFARGYIVALDGEKIRTSFTADMFDEGTPLVDLSGSIVGYVETVEETKQFSPLGSQEEIE